MTITRSDIAAHLEQSIRTGFLVGKKNYTPLRSKFVREIGSDGAFEDYSDMGSPPMPVKNAGKLGPGGTTRAGGQVVGGMNAGEAITVFGAEEQSMRVYNVDWELTLAVSHNAIDDDRAGDVEAWAKGAAVSFERHMDFLAFDALNRGESTYYGPAYDGLAFFHDAHIDPNATYTTGQDNKNASAISMADVTAALTTFETVKVAGSAFKDSRGNPMGLAHSLLIVSSALERLGTQIAVNREGVNLALGTGINPYAGNVSLLVAPGGYLDTTAWFVIDPTLPTKPINLQKRKEATLSIWDDEKTGDGGMRYFKWHARYVPFYGDWRLAIQGNT